LGNAVVSKSCTTPCSGDSSEICGGTDNINIYQIIGRNIPVPGWDSVGCYTDQAYPTKALTGNEALPLITIDMTPQACATYCSEFKYFGVEDGK
jgi:hypothetical protein